MLRVFPSVYAIDVPQSFNTILVATRQPTSATFLTENARSLATSADPRLIALLERAASSIAPLGRSDVIFTDDRAPVERLVDAIVLDFLLAGRADEFRLDTVNED